MSGHRPGLLLSLALVALSVPGIAQSGNPGPANPPPLFSKVFVPNQLNQGELSTLTFTIDNSASSVNASDVDFRDNFPGRITVGPGGGGVSTCIGGSIVADPGADFMRYVNGIVGAGETCTVSVVVQVEGPGTLVNETELLTSSLGISGTATASVTTPFFPLDFSMLFEPSLIAPGDVTILRFLIADPNEGGVGELEFTHTLPPGLVIASPPNAIENCQSGTLSAPAGSSQIEFSGGITNNFSLGCAVRVDVTPSEPGAYFNVSSPLTSLAGTSPPAEGVLQVPEPVALSREILGNPALSGALVDFRYSLTNPSSFFHIFIAFEDPLEEMLPGLRLAEEQSQLCGPSSQLSGDGILSFRNGFLPPGESCTFVARVRVPATAEAGSYPGETGEITSIVTNAPFATPGAGGVLEITSLSFDKSFPPRPAVAGSVVPLAFSLSNPSGDDDTTGLEFSDSLEAVLPGLRAVGLPTEPCGPGSLISGGEEIQLTGGTLGAGENCQFSVEVEIPETAQAGTYLNLTSPLDAVVDGTPVPGGPDSMAQAPLEVEEAPVLPPTNPLEIPTLGGLSLLLLAAALGYLGMRRLRV